MRNLLSLLIFLFLILFSYSQYLDNNDEYGNLNPSNNDNITDINLDHFVTYYINHTSNITYKLLISNDSEQIFFDFQSEYGCLYINIDNDNELLIKDLSEDFIFCSNGTNNLFTLDKKEINKKREKDINTTIQGLNMIITVSSSSSELNLDFNFYYSLKVSLRKPEINIFEINSSHKMLCKTERINEIYRCIFIFVNNNDNNNEQNDKKLIIYSTSMNIFADYINKSEYDNWNTTYLLNNIPNNNSLYNNSDMDIINIPNLESDKYVYISVESNNETVIEIMSQIVSNEDKVKFPDLNDIQIYSINKTSFFDFNNLTIDKTNNISLSIVTLYGKANINFENDDTIEYITDTIENQLIFDIDLNECINNNKSKLTINNLEENNNKEYIFYISYTIKTNNLLKELKYGKSSKLLYNNFEYLILYQELKNILLPININLQLYNSEIINVTDKGNFTIEIIIIPKEDIYELKLNNSYIDSYAQKIIRKFDDVLSAANIYLSSEDMINFEIFKNQYLIIHLKNVNNTNNKLIIGSTITQMNSLKYPSERIYHYGQLNCKEKMVYKLKGKKEYHLMRLEFSSNSDYIGWSVKRTNESENYRQNDTDLSFVIERWINGRELITMYIERGEDIYLTVFHKNKEIENENLTNYIFKYVNSAKNGDFKNYYIKNDVLNYNNSIKRIEIEKINKIPSYYTCNYYLRIINKDDFIENEELNTISIIASNSEKIINGKEDNNNIIFDLNEVIDEQKTYFVNAYSIINEKNSNFEYVSYSRLIIQGRMKNERNIHLIIASLSIGLLIIIFLFFSLIKYCNRRRRIRPIVDYDFNDHLLLEI